MTERQPRFFRSEPIGADAVPSVAQGLSIADPGLYAHIAQNMQVGLYVWQLENREDLKSFRLIATNPAATQFTGVPMDAVLGKTILEVFPRLLETDLPGTYREIILSGTERDLQDVRYGDDRVPEGVFSVKAFPLPDDCVGVVFENITERKRTEEALRSSESRYRWLFDSIQDSHLVVSADRRILDCNPIFTSVFGYAREEVLGESTLLLYASQEEFEKFGRKIRENRTKARVTSTVEFRKKSGEIFAGETLVYFLRDPQGRVNGYFGIVRDVTERKRAEEALRKSEEKYRSLVANLPTVTWTSDSAGRTTFITPNIENLYGFTPQEIYGAGDHFWLERIHPEERGLVKTAYRSLFTSHQKFDVEYRIQRKDGVWIWLHDQAVATYEHGGVWYADGICSDVTARKMAESRLAAEHAVTRILAESQTFEEAVPIVLRAIGESLGCSLAAMWRVEREGVEMACTGLWRSPSASVDEFEASCRSSTFSRGSGLPGQVWADGRPAWISDLSSDSNFPRLCAAARAGLRSGFAFPVRAEEELFGVMEFFMERPAAPDAALLSMMGAIGSEIGQFIRRKQVEQSEKAARTEAEAALERLRAIQSIADAALAHLALDDLLHELLSRVRTVLRTDSATVLLVDEANQCLVVRASEGLDRDRTGEQRIPLDQGIAGRIARRGEPMIVEDTSQTEVFAPWFRDYVKSLLGVPLVVEGHVTGVLHVGTSVHRRFTAEDSQLLQLVADRAAPAIDRARLFEEVREGRARLRALSHRLVDLQEAERREIARELHDEIGQLLTGLKLLLESSERPPAGMDRALAPGGGAAGRRPGREKGPASASDGDSPRLRRQARSAGGSRRRAAGGRKGVLSVPAPDGHEVAPFAQDVRRNFGESVDVTPRKKEAARSRRSALRAAGAPPAAGVTRMGLDRDQLDLDQEVARRNVDAGAGPENGESESVTVGRSEGTRHRMKALVNDLMGRVRELSMNLRPAMLDDLGLVPAVLWQLERYQDQTGIRVEFSHSGLDGRFSPEIETACFRIVQEALTNVARHARTSEAKVEIRADGAHLWLQIEDRGAGFDPQLALAGRSSGLTGMRERARLLGGRLRIESTMGNGTQLLAELPLSAPESGRVE